MKKETITRKQLYDLLWSKSKKEIIQKYLLSYTELNELCKKKEIPTPENGYWIKLKFGKESGIVPLPDLKTGEDKIELIIREEGVKITKSTPHSILTSQIENDFKKLLVVPKSLKKPEPVILNTMEFETLLEKKGWRVEYHKKHLGRIEVEDKNKKRALRFLNTFVKLVEKRGHIIKSDKYESLVEVKGINFTFRLRETNKRVATGNNYPKYDYIPTGLFVFKTGKYWGEKEWRDGRKPIEQQLAKIIAHVELVADKELIWKKKNRIAKIEREAKEKIERELLEKKAAELERFNKLLNDAKKHQEAVLIRNYITARHTLKENSTTEDLEWLQWANDKADWYDPLVNKNDELLS